MFVIAVISTVLLEELATLFSITLCVCVCVSALRMFFLALIDVSLAEQVLQCFYERNLLSFMCLGQKRKEKKKTESEGKECVKDFQKEERKKKKTHQQPKELHTLKQSD